MKTNAKDANAPIDRDVHDQQIVRRCSDDLPAKFTRAERAAYDWLFQCQIGPWLVDHITKKVTAPEKNFRSLVEYAKHHGMQ